MSYLKHNFVLRPLLSFVCHLVSVVIFSKVLQGEGEGKQGVTPGFLGFLGFGETRGLSAVVFQCQSHSDNNNN